LKHGFEYSLISKKKQREAALGLGLQLSNEENALIDDKVVEMNTTNVSQLSQIHWEDLLCLQEGGSLILYFRKHDNVLTLQSKCWSHVGRIAHMTTI